MTKLAIPQPTFAELFKDLADVHRGWCVYCKGNEAVCAAAPAGGCSLRDCELAMRLPPEANELVAMMRDANRYRWLRAKHDAGDEQAFVYGAHGKLDEYIDAEMAASSKPQLDDAPK